MHKPEDIVSAELQAAAKQVVQGKLYRHYKNSNLKYKVLHLGIIESNDSICVIYQVQYGAKLIFVRPLTSWLDRVEWEGKTVNRFSQVLD